MDSGFECAIGVPGKEDAFFILGVKSFESENVLEMRGFPCTSADEPPSAKMAAFSISKLLLRYLKLNFGRKLFKGDLLFDDEWTGDSSCMEKIGLGMGEKLTLLGVAVGVKAISILTKSSLASCTVLVGISKTRSSRLRCSPSGVSSIISIESPNYEKINKNFHHQHIRCKTKLSLISNNQS